MRAEIFEPKYGLYYRDHADWVIVSSSRSCVVKSGLWACSRSP
jgi:hypothetical protein